MNDWTDDLDPDENDDFRRGVDFAVATHRQNDEEQQAVVADLRAQLAAKNAALLAAAEVLTQASMDYNAQGNLSESRRIKAAALAARQAVGE